MDYQLEDLIDISLFQSLQDKLNLVYSFPSAIIDNDGKVLTAVAWQDICTKFHRTNPECEKECIKSDQYILEHLHEANPAVSYQCPHGMIDNATPIIIDGKHLGNFFTGQFFLEKPDLDFFKKQAKKYGFDEKAYLMAVEKVPIWTKEKLSLYLDFIKEFIEIIASIGLKTLKEIETRKVKEKSEELFKSVVQNSSDLVVLTDEKGVVTYLSPRCEEVLGYPESKIMGKIMPDFIHPDDKIKCQQEWEQVILHEKELHDLEYRIIDGQNKERWISHSARMVKTNEKVLGMQNTIRNITKQKQWEDAIKKSEAKHSSMLSNISDVIGIIGADGIMKYKSSNIEKWFGWLPQDLIGTDGFSNVHPDDLKRIQKEFFTLLEKENSSITLEYRYKCKDGSYKPIEVTAKNLVNDPIIKGVLLNYKDITERKLSEEKLQDNETLLLKIAENYPNSFVTIIEKDFTIGFSAGREFINQNLDPKEFIGLTLEQVFGDKTHIVKEYYKNTFNGKEQSFELFINEQYQHYRTVPLRDSDESVTSILVVVENITKRKQAEMDLKENEESLNTAQKIAKIGSWEMDTITKKLSWSKEMFDILEVGTDQEPTFELYYSRVHPDDLAFVQESGKNVLSDNEAIRAEYRLLTPSKKIKYVATEGQQHLDNKNNLIKMSGIVQDITARKLAELELIEAKEKSEESEGKLKTALGSMTDAIFISDREGTFIDFNEAFATFHKFKNKEECTKTLKEYPIFLDVFYLDGEFVPLEMWVVSRALRGETGLNKEYVLKRKDTAETWVGSYNYSPIRNNEGDIIGSVVTARDITAQKKHEKELLLAKEKAEESDRLKSAFLANMSHEIRTPMNGILGFTGLLQDSNLSIENQKDYIDIIQKSGDRLLNTVNDIIEISKIESGDINVTKSEVDLIGHLDTLITFFRTEAENKGLEIVVQNNINGNDLAILTDKNKLSSILSNLIKNAIKYTIEGTINVGLKIENNQIVFSCQDSGIGIPKNKLEAIFNRFEQADIEDKHARQGSGLGLAIVKSYVEILDGKIWVESEVGKGSAFYVSLPHNPIKTNKENLLSKEKSLDIGKKNINVLIVEDDEHSSIHLSIVTESIVKNVTSVENGIEAVDACKKGAGIDLVLMDMKMPLMGGIEATKRIREFNKDVIIIAQTAYAFAEDKQKALDAGCNDFISKPIRKDKLFEIINKYF